ncbi:MAG: alpha/beta hydrolase fold domain-containing protein [Marinomonas sp.]|uniref:alpha/beta hydrolase fold domain-containing protein n=1 Tax=Marinomonas sp. TaxID=1904862 RepID=UPI003F9E54F8
MNLVSVDYRLAPEHQYPCDIKDCLSLVDDLLAQGKFIILVGDSAGANLAACVANARSNYTQTQLLGQILIYPVLAHNELTKSMNMPMHLY